MKREITWLEKTQYVTMLLSVSGLIVFWRIGLWATLLFALVSFVCLVYRFCGPQKATRFVLNPALTPSLRKGLIFIVVYWLLLLVSMAYTEDTASGWDIVLRKAVLLVYSLSLLLTDTSYITKKHLRIVGYTLALSLLVRFFYYVVLAIVKLVRGETVEEVTGMYFDPHHHAYTALYLETALLFFYFEFHYHWNALPRWWRRAMIAAILLMIVYIIMVNSRAGMLALYTIELFCCLHFALTRHTWLKGLLLALLLGGYTVTMEVVLPGHKARLAATLSDLTADGRTKIYMAGLEAASKSPLFGYGVGDYQVKLLDQFDEDDFVEGVEHCFNAHNQYIETLLSTGLIGLISLLLWLLWPLCQAWKTFHKKNEFWFLLMLTFCVLFSSMFESMLERQMGLLFIGTLIPIMLLTINLKQYD